MKNDHIKNVVYCSKTGKPYTVEFDDKLVIGMHRKGTQVTLPLDDESFMVTCKDGKLDLVFKQDDKIEVMIKCLQDLRNLKQNYDKN